MEAMLNRIIDLEDSDGFVTPKTRSSTASRWT